MLVELHKVPKFWSLLYFTTKTYQYNEFEYIVSEANASPYMTTRTQHLNVVFVDTQPLIEAMRRLISSQMFATEASLLSRRVIRREHHPSDRQRGSDGRATHRWPQEATSIEACRHVLSIYRLRMMMIRMVREPNSSDRYRVVFGQYRKKQNN